MQSIGDFAEQLIQQEVADIKEGKAVPPVFTGEKPDPTSPDITSTVVPESFMESVLGEAYDPSRYKATPVVEEAQPVDEPEPKEEEVIEEDTSQLLTEETAQKLIPLLENLTNLVTEMMSAAMTTTGNLGVNLGGPGLSASERKTGKVRSKSKKDVLKSSIRTKLRNR